MGYVMKHWKTTILKIIINQVFLNWIVVSAPNLITMSKVWDYISLGTPTLHISMHIQNDRLIAKDISNSLFLNEELRILALNLLEICSWNLMPMGNLPYPIQPHGILLDVTQESPPPPPPPPPPPQPTHPPPHPDLSYQILAPFFDIHENEFWSRSPSPNVIMLQWVNYRSDQIKFLVGPLRVLTDCRSDKQNFHCQQVRLIWVLHNIQQDIISSENDIRQFLLNWCVWAYQDVYFIRAWLYTILFTKLGMVT